MDTKKEDKKKKKKVTPLAPCNENSYIVNKNKIREGLGVSSKAKIIME